MPPGEIRTHNPNKRGAADPRLRPRGHWDRLNYHYITFILEKRLSCIVTSNGRRIGMSGDFHSGSICCHMLLAACCMLSVFIHKTSFPYLL